MLAPHSDCNTTLRPKMTGNSVCRRLNSAMETVTETCSSVRHVSLVGMNSSNRVISSGEVGPRFSSIISTHIGAAKQQRQFSK